MLENTQIEAIANAFDDPDETIELFDLWKLLSEDYAKPNRLIRDALLEDLLYVDTIEDDKTIMLALTEWGEAVWAEIQEDEEDED